MCTWKRRGRGLSWWQRSGESLAEFALVLLPLFLVLFGIIQYGFIFAATMTVRNATVIAARYAMLGPTNSTNVAKVQAVARQAVGPMLNPNNVTAVNVSLTNVTVGATNGATSVEIQYSLPLIIPWIVRGTNVSNDHLLLKATTIMR